MGLGTQIEMVQVAYTAVVIEGDAMLKRWFGLLALTLVLSGCGAKFAYNNLDLITPWYVDDYIEFDEPQQATFDRHLEQLHRWHRETELPQYRQLFTELHAHLYQDQLNPQLLSTSVRQLRGHWNALIQQASPAVIELSRTLTDQQRREFFQALEERNEKRLKRADSPAEHKQESVERIEKWMGPLTKQQRNWVESFAEANPDLTEETVAAHREFQNQLSSLISQNSMADFPPRLSALLADALGSSEEGRRLNTLREQQLAARVELFQRLWLSASDNQKRKVRSKLKGYIDDIDDLIGEGEQGS